MNALQILGEIAKAASKLPPPVLSALLDVVKAIAKSKDPVRAARLAALAAASKAGTEAVIRKALGK